MVEEKNTFEPLLFKDFELERLIFEVKFISREFYPSKIREFWDEVQKELYGEFKIIQNEEGSTTVRYDNKIEVKVSSDNFILLQFYPKPFEDFLKVSEVIYNAVVRILKVGQIRRVGLRFFYCRNYDNPSFVAEALYQTPYIGFPENLSLIGNSKPLIPSYTIGWQDEEKGITYRLRGKAEKISLDLPLLLAATGDFPYFIEKEYNQVILDMDIYLHSEIPVGRFFPNEWLKVSYKVAKEEGLKFFGE